MNNRSGSILTILLLFACTKGFAQITLSVVKENTTCTNNSGKIIVTPANGVPPYRYSLDGGAFQFVGYFLSQPAGVHTIVVKDNINQTATATVTLLNSYSMPVVTATATPVYTCSNTDGTVTLNASGGQPPYAFSMDNVHFQSSNVFGNLAASHTYFFVKDANGCTAKVEGVVHGLVVCPVGGYLTIEGQGCGYIGRAMMGPAGVLPNTFSMDSIHWQALDTFYNIGVGVHKFYGRDAVNHVWVHQLQLLDECGLQLQASSVSACANDGAIMLTASGGTPPYQYSMDGISFQSSNTFPSLSQGSYSAMVKDATGDFRVLSNIVITNGCITATATTVSATCGRSNGGITVTASGGTPPYQYSSNLLNFQTANSFTNLAPGNYTILVKDVSGISTAVPVTVNHIAAPALVINATSDSCNTGGTITVNTTGGTAPFQYSLDSSAWQGNNSFVTKPAGSYTVYVRDARGCNASGAVTVIKDNPVHVDVADSLVICEGESAMISGSSNGNTFIWSPAGGLNNATILNATASPAHTTVYTVTATKGICSSSDSIKVIVWKQPVVDAGPDLWILAGGSIRLHPAVNDTSFSFRWLPAADLSNNRSLSPVASPLQSRSYILTATNGDCFASDTMHITVMQPVTIPTAFSPNGDLVNDEWMISNIADYRGATIDVYNRSGQRVFHTQKGVAWNGKLNGKPLPVGIYYYVIDLKEQSLERLAGWVMLLR